MRAAPHRGHARPQVLAWCARPRGRRRRPGPPPGPWPRSPPRWRGRTAGGSRRDQRGQLGARPPRSPPAWWPRSPVSRSRIRASNSSRSRRPPPRRSARRPGASGWPPRPPLALQGLAVQRALAGHHEGRGAHGGVEAQPVQHVGRARHERGAQVGPQPARQAAGGAGHRARRAGPGAPPWPGAPAGASALRPARVRRPSGARTPAAASSNGVRTSQITSIRGRTPASASARTAPVAAVGGGRARPRPPARWSAPASQAAAISSPVPRVEAATASRSSSATRPSPLACAHSTTAVSPSAQQREARPRRAAPADRSPWRCAARRRGRSSASIVPSPPSATGMLAPPRRRRRAAPRATAAATSAAENVPLKLSGATRTGQLHKRRPEGPLGRRRRARRTPPAPASGPRAPRTAPTISSAASSSGKPPTPVPKATSASDRAPSSSAFSRVDAVACAMISAEVGPPSSIVAAWITQRAGMSPARGLHGLAQRRSASARRTPPAPRGRRRGDGRGHAAAVQQVGVRGVGDGVDLQRGHVGLEHLELHG